MFSVIATLIERTHQTKRILGGGGGGEGYLTYLYKVRIRTFSKSGFNFSLLILPI